MSENLKIKRAYGCVLETETWRYSAHESSKQTQVIMQQVETKHEVSK